jgi:hypothetical protein
MGAPKNISLEEFKRRISIAKTGKPSSMKGRKLPEWWVQKLRDSHKGQTHSIGTRKKLSVALKGAKSHLWRGGIDTSSHRTWMKGKNMRLRKAAFGSHTVSEWETLRAQYNWTCPMCGRSEPEIRLSLDHIIPLSKGGSNNIENIQPLCRSCNCRKHTKIIRFSPINKGEPKLISLKEILPSTKKELLDKQGHDAIPSSLVPQPLLLPVIR